MNVLFEAVPCRINGLANIDAFPFLQNNSIDDSRGFQLIFSLEKSLLESLTGHLLPLPLSGIEDPFDKRPRGPFVDPIFLGLFGSIPER